MISSRTTLSIALSLAGTAILSYSYSIQGATILPWLAIVPLLIVLCRSNLIISFLTAILFGGLFIHGVFHWVLNARGYGIFHHAILLTIYGSIYAFLLFIFIYVVNKSSYRTSLWALPFAWVTVEYIRAHLFFLALPMGLLGHTQYLSQSVVQIANIGGVYMISFLIVLVNAAIAGIILHCIENKRKGHTIYTTYYLIWSGLKYPLSIAAITTLTLTVVYGLWLGSKKIEGDTIKVALIQGNIEQSKKWNPKHADMIMKTYEDLTLQAASKNSDIIIWPETAIPGDIMQNSNTLSAVKSLAQKTGSHFVIGSAQGVKFERENSINLKYKNSAYAFSPQSRELFDQRYDKIRLFPFGEYLPYADILPWHHLKVKSANEYISGKEYTIFRHPEFNFCTTICWENLFPDLCRKFVQKGAQVIINITNEARFGQSSAPHQLMSISVFRAVENGVYVVRCANTGISCIIDPRGKIVKKIMDDAGNDIFIRGILSGTIIPRQSNTFYSKYGDVFAWVCIFVTIGFISFALFSKVQNPKIKYISPSK